MDGESKSRAVVKREELSWSLVVEQRMANHHFDAINYVHQLTAAGLPLAQAEAHANALAGVLLPILTDLAAIKQTVDDLTVRMGGLTVRMDGLTERMDGLTERMDGLTERMGGLTERMDGLSERMDEMGRRIDRLETRLNWAISILVATQLALFGMVGGLYLAH